MNAGIADASVRDVERPATTVTTTSGQSPWPGPRPRLAFFRPARHDLSRFVDAHLEDHLRCLRQFFDVTLVTGDADYDAVCDQVEPDLALFESGVYVRRRRRYTKTWTHPHVPKVGLLNADAYCVTRSVYLADMHEWGVDTHFSISPVMAAHNPDIADRAYAWPNFADRTVFHSYPVDERVPLLLSGSRQAHYPWRVAVDDALRGTFDVSPQPHHGSFDKVASASMPVGEAYARQLSSALIVPACGTFAHELVRKHLEIPAAGAVLVAQRTPVLELAGFQDGVNCVFADASDVVDKVRWLIDNPGERDRIARAGQELVHERHDITVRDQLRQWFELQRVAGPGESVVQDDPFGPMRIVARRSDDRPVTYVSPPSLGLEILAEGRELAGEGRLGEAAARYEALRAMHFVPEAELGLARVRLAQGEVDEARAVVTELIARSVRDWGAVGPDPVEWALYLRVLLCAGDLGLARRRARDYPSMSHPELERARTAVAALTRRAVPAGSGPVRRSVHVVPTTTWTEWVDALRHDLVAAGRHDLAAQAALVVESTHVAGEHRRRRPRTQAPPREFRLPFWPRVIPGIRRRLPWRWDGRR